MLIKFSAAETSQDPVSVSSCNFATFKLSTSIVYLLDLIPRPLALLSTSAPIALVKFKMDLQSLISYHQHCALYPTHSLQRDH